LSPTDTDHLVATIIAAHNCETTIHRAVCSALEQTETAEVFVIDDGSTDNSFLEAKSADDGSGRLKLLSLPTNRGPSAARNCALSQCASPWIGILDADDYFLPGRLQGLLRYADNADLIADDIWRVQENDSEGPRQLFLGPRLPQARTINFTDFVLSNITSRRRQRGELGFIKPLMRRSFLDAHCLRYQEHMRLGEDYELYARALACGARLLLVPPQGYVSVVRAQSLSGQHSENDLQQLRDCDKSLEALPQLNAQEKAALHRHYLSIDCRLQWRLLILAVKQRSLRNILASFRRPMPVPAYLLFHLLEQLVLRCKAKLLKQTA
jgi:succinoglycan biosynthesis protein ExoU